MAWKIHGIVSRGKMKPEKERLLCYITAVCAAHMTFFSRTEAGEKLGQHLRRENLAVDLVVGLPRGGVVVAAEVARVLQRPLAALVVRKIGHPRHREFAVGALAEEGTVLLDEEVVQRTSVGSDELREIIAEETARLDSYRKKFHPHGSPQFSGKAVLIVDDGLATGATAEAAVRSAKRHGAAHVIVAVPVASDSAVERLKGVADSVIALHVDPQFDAVGRYYRSFPQNTDEEVVALLQRRDR
jgi:predicted phosphoribosyltransferase